MIGDYGADPGRVAVIPPGVDLEKWRPAERSPDDVYRVLFVGAEFDRKGGDLLLRAFESLSSNAELRIVTKSAVTPSDRVRVINDLQPNDERLVELFRTSDVFVLPSLAETFGIAAVEASAAGLPVIASNVGGLCDIVVDGKTGLLVGPGDVTALGEALRLFETNPSLRLRYGLHARQHALEHFDATVNATKLADLVQTVAGE
jgi:glycosyltransferase involved in cell wall biosynthesis